MMASKPEMKRWLVATVWVLRVAVGAVFVFSGFAKAVDPWGFIYKVGEYLTAWGVAWLPEGIVLIGSILLSMFEFVSGLMLLLGCLRHVAALSLAGLMLFMMPLSAYIWIWEPVADCGCFGDALVISNGATFAKNVVLMAALLFLCRYNMKVSGLVRPILQWMPISAAIVYCFAISILGYMVQPIVDFRPYKVGSPLLAEESDDAGDLKLVYERDGREQEFGIDELPDSAWTFVRRIEGSEVKAPALAIYDGDDDVTEDVIDTDGPQMLLLVANPEFHARARSSMANRVNDAMEEMGGSMIGILPLSGEALEKWSEVSQAEFPLFTSEATAIKEVARGDAALVFMDQGRVVWKYNMYCLRGDFPGSQSPALRIESVKPIERQGLALWLSLALALVILFSSLLGLAKRHPSHKQ